MAHVRQGGQSIDIVAVIFSRKVCAEDTWSSERGDLWKIKNWLASKLATKICIRICVFFIEVAIVVYFVHSLLLLKYIKSSIRKLTHSMNLGRALPDYPPFYKRYIVPMQVHFVYFQSVLPWFDDFVSLKCNYVWLFCHLHLPTCPQVITFVSSYWYALLLKSCENR